MADHLDRFGAELVARTPQLRRYALALVRDSDAAADLVQDTLANALRSRRSYETGTNIDAWLTVIMRNAFVSRVRRSPPMFIADLGISASSLVDRLRVPPSQEPSLELQQLADALDGLPTKQRQALVWVALHGHSYEEAARMGGCSVGTIKSRVSRARRSLLRSLGPMQC